MHPNLVESHVRAEQEAGHLLEPLPEPLVTLCQTSPIGLIPKTPPARQVEVNRGPLVTARSQCQGRNLE